MKRLSPREMLQIWESRLQFPVMERSLHLLSVLYDTDVETIGKLSIGERDARLLTFREWIFGPKLMNVSQCPQCSTRIEWETDIRDIRLQASEEGQANKVLLLEEDGYKVAFRLPNSLDILACLNSPAKAGDPSVLISRCILEIQSDQPEKQDVLPMHVMAKLEEQMAEADPQADITMVLNCPECNHRWHSSFDILHYLWMEIDNWAKKMLREVAVLARAFGWSETDILNMGHHRRKMYLDLIS
jgi:hypothetical protein